MLLANKYKIPDTCPRNCPYLKTVIGWNSFCTRCPIFLCKKHPDTSEYADADGMFYFMEVEDFREDWALEFQEWFKGDMKDLPKLLLQNKRRS